MLPILNTENQQTITTIELRDLINQSRSGAGEPEVANRHFLARVEDELDGELSQRKSFTHPANGSSQWFYDITLEQATLVGMRESKSVRRAVLAKLKEMEVNKFPSIPQTYSEALRLAADQAEKIQEQQLLIEQQKPAVQFIEKYVEASSTKSLREAAKVLGIKERDFIAMLEDNRILFRQGGTLLPYAEHQHAKRFEVKTGEKGGFAFHQTRFTPSGLAWIVKRLSLD